MRTIGASEVRYSGEILKRVHDRIEPVAIERRGKQLAVLVPVEEDLEPIADRRTESSSPRIAGSFGGGFVL